MLRHLLRKHRVTVYAIASPLAGAAGPCPEALRGLEEKHFRISRFDYAWNVVKGFLSDLPLQAKLYRNNELRQAMACGTPVICSRVASLPEVAGDAALMIDPNSEEELVEALGKIIGDESLRQEMRRKGLIQVKRFSWQESAGKVLHLLESLS